MSGIEGSEKKNSPGEVPGTESVRLRVDEMQQHGLKAPVFEDLRGNFVATLYGMGEQDSEEDNPQDNPQDTPKDTPQDNLQETIKMKILKYCVLPRTRKEISEFVGIKDVRYLKEAYLSKLLEQNMIKMTVPDKPTSRNQKYVRTVTGTKGGPFFLE